MSTGRFHRLVQKWFEERFGEPTAPQAAGWRHIAAGVDTLIAAPTGSGKTLAAFLWAIDGLIRDAAAGTLEDRTRVVYVSPLKALSNDIQKNLQEPLDGILRLAAAEGVALPEIRVMVRTGDTPAHERQQMARRPPHVLVTTPESLYILLTAEGSRHYLATAATVIVDEIHAVAGDKRGAHLAISLERLDALAGHPLQRIGLSATQRPIEEIARLLVGAGRLRPDGDLECAIVDIGHRRDLDLSVEVPGQPPGPVASHEMWAEIYDRIVALIPSHRTTIVFVNTRRLVERVAHQLTKRLGEGRVAAHHGSLSRRTRLEAERRLKAGEIPVVVATASLELGIDVGTVDLVCNIGAPRALATLLQRVGRSGHVPSGRGDTATGGHGDGGATPQTGVTPKGILFPLTRDELLQCAAAVRAVRAGELDRVTLPHAPLDILAQQAVAIAASGEVGEDELWRLVRRAYPFRDLRRDDFEAVLEMLSEGVATARGRRSAHLHRDRVHARLRGRRGARLAAITSGGAIPDTADYDVVEDPAATFVGKVNEDFAVESLAGDIFLLGNKSWRIRRVEAGRVHVEDAQGAPPTIPFWLGEAPGRTIELSTAVAAVRREVASLLPDAAAASEWLRREAGVDQAGADQIVAYIAETLAMLGTVPTQQVIVAERFFDEAGGMQLVLHAPFGARINRAWGLALRKRFCRTFDFELQAAATDDGIVLSLGEQHSFPLEGVFAMVRSATLEEDLVQAALAAPMFGNRWRWNATRALALLRHTGGRRVPMPIQRMRAEDLLAAVFPAQVACQDNHEGGPIEPPDHPLVKETIANCLHEAMDVEGLRAVIGAIERGEVQTLGVDTPAPSPMCHEILNANPYAFLDDAPLEERRARAVALRRTDPDLARGVGALDQAAIDEVRAQAWPDVRDPHELHDVLLTLVVLPLAASEGWTSLAEELIRDGRATRASCLTAPNDGHSTLSPSPVPRHKASGQASPFERERERDNLFASLSPTGGKGEGEGTPNSVNLEPETVNQERCCLVAAERLRVVRAALPSVRFDPEVAPPPPTRGEPEVPAQADAMRAIVQGWMEHVGPITAASLAARLGLPQPDVQIALVELESRGAVLRGRFTPGGVGDAIEWCDRRLLARIHRLTIGRLRREIEPVSAADLIRFLLRWQHVQPGTQLHGRQGLLQVIGQLQGLELPAPAWERDVLPARIAHYNPTDLEALCLSGEVAWARLRLQPTLSDLEVAAGPVFSHSSKRRQIPTRSAPLAFVLRQDLPWLLDPAPLDLVNVEGLSGGAREVASHLGERGAAFLADIARAAGRLPAQVEGALWELVACGLVTGDGIAGLRALLKPEEHRRLPHRRLRMLRGGMLRDRLIPTGRWSLLHPVRPGEEPRPRREEIEEAMARQLLRRYGVVFREVLAREGRAPAWRTLLGIYRQLEARGEIRGGRFVGGFVGEQFALPEAVDVLREVRRKKDEGEPVIVTAADPLNLVGILTPGARVSPFSGQVIAYRAGVPVEVGDLGAVMHRVRQMASAPGA
jgi:ATP-dependent Lhr-like helicase